MTDPVVYLVGGAVRDELLGKPAKDRDYVVTGATHELMLEQDYEQVGSGFPVYISPINGDEYALARTERKIGKGHKGFETHFDVDTTIEEDLIRRCLSINSIAFNTRNEEYIDPHGGIKDLENGILRPTSEAFKEDPLRLYRLARFSATFPDFKIHETGYAYCKEILESGELETLPPERVGMEFEKAMKAENPVKFFEFLKDIGALEIHFKEIFDLIGQTQPEKWHPEGDSYVHTMLVLGNAVKRSESPHYRAYALFHDFGKGITPKDKLPSHHGHEKAGVALVENFVKRLKLSNKYSKLGKKIAEYHMHVHKTLILNPKTFVNVWGAFRGNLDDLQKLVDVSEDDMRGRGEKSLTEPYPQAKLFMGAMNAISNVVVPSEDIMDKSNETIKNIFRGAHIRAVKNYLTKRNL